MISRMTSKMLKVMEIRSLNRQAMPRRIRIPSNSRLKYLPTKTINSKLEKINKKARISKIIEKGSR